MAIGFVGMPRMPARKPGAPVPLTPSAAQTRFSKETFEPAPKPDGSKSDAAKADAPPS
jgi:hypothetical protein